MKNLERRVAELESKVGTATKGLIVVKWICIADTWVQSAEIHGTVHTRRADESEDAFGRRLKALVGASESMTIWLWLKNFVPVDAQQ